jgi:hypothetical protein
MLNFVNAPERLPGRPEGTSKEGSIWDEMGKADPASLERAHESEWSRKVSENHPSVRAKRMKPEGGYFGG